MESITEKNICDEAKEIAMDLLPEKSAARYLRAHEKFLLWKSSKKIDEKLVTEDIMLVYFHHLQSKYSPSSLWAEYSMLRTVILRNENIDIDYTKLKAFLKKASKGYHPKKSNVFRPEDIRRFLAEADDNQYLATKVIMIFGVYGAIRGDELCKVDVNDVSEQGEVFVIKIPKTKNDVVRSFTVEDVYAEFLRKYKKLRPPAIGHTRFFINYNNGKCTVQPIGRNKFLNTPKVIAQFLNLAEPLTYTGHSLRRTSATILADGGADLLTLKRHGGWRSSTVAEGYIEESVLNKRKIGEVISGQIQFKISTQTMVSSTVTSSMVQTGVASNATTSTIDVRSQSSIATLNDVELPMDVAENSKTVTVELPMPVTEIPNPVAEIPKAVAQQLQGVHFHNCSHINLYLGRDFPQ